MKSNRIALIILPIALLVLVWAVPYNQLIAKPTKAKAADAAEAETRAKDLATQLKVSEAAQAREAANLEQLKKLRQVLPDVPEQFVSPIMRVLSEKASAHGLSLSVQDQAAPSVGTPVTTVAPVAGAPAANPDEGRPFLIKIQLSGSQGGILNFIAEMPATQRLFVNSVALKPANGATAFDQNPASPVTADIELRAYVAASASLTG